MHLLTNQDFRDILDLIYVANSHLEPTGMRVDVLHAMEPIFHIDSANFFLGDSRYSHWEGIDITDAVSLGIDKHYVEQFGEHYYCYDPFLRGLNSGKTIFTTGEVCPYSCWVKLEYYNDFLKPQKIHHELAIVLRSGIKLCGVIALFRPREQSNFSQREIAKANILAPHLATALENISLLSKIKEERKLLQTASGPSLEGILLLDYNFQTIYCNFKAKQRCLSLSRNRPAQTSEIDGENLPIPPEILEDCLALKEDFQNGRQITSPCRIRTVWAEEGKRFQIKTSLSQQPSSEVSTPYFLASLEDLSETYKIRGEMLKENYHLTEREIEVTSCVSKGLTNEDVADKLCISRFTVENHLKSIFEKTGVKNRTELAGRVEFPWTYHPNVGSYCFEVAQDVLDSHLDLGVVVSTDYGMPNLRSIPVSAGEKLVLVASPSSPISQKERVKWIDLCSYPLLLGPETSASRRIIFSMFEAERLKEPPIK